MVQINRAKQGEIEFANAVANSDSDLNIDAKAVSDDELKSVVGKYNCLIYGGGGGAPDDCGNTNTSNS